MNSNIKLICFDLDNTLTKGFSWERLNVGLGVTTEEDRLMAKWHKEGVLPYDQWVQLLLRIYKTRSNASLADVEEALSRFEFLDGVTETIKHLQEKNYEVALISGSMDVYVDKVARDLGIKYAQANNIFVFDSSDILKDIVTFGEEGLSKLHHLESFCRKLGIQITECAAIGDGDNDLELFKATGHGITFKDSPIEKDAWQVIDTFSDLQKIF